jgi:hypothetical protein
VVRVAPLVTWLPLVVLTLAACTAPSASRASGPAAEDVRGAWLDQPLVNWNAPGAAVPTAPPPVGEPPWTARCARLLRSPTIPEERAVVDRGWSLVGAPETRDQIVIVTGSTSVDGMCRPLGYQGFVFLDGRFAGTLSPAPMDARTDGAETQRSIEGPREVRARYARYRRADPLCCPSRTSEVSFGLEPHAQGPLLVPRGVVTTPNPP